MNDNQRLTRRTLLGRAGVGALAATAATALGPIRPSEARPLRDDRVRVAVIGTGGMGTRHLEILATNPNCTVAAVSDVFVRRYENAQRIVEERSGRKPDGCQDFRRILDRKDIDAIFIPTPDHWHPLITIMGCQAAKDVYVEKPVSTTVEEGRAMVSAARRYGRVVQAGTQQRSMPVFQKAIDVVHSGVLGEITTAGAWVDTNSWSNIETPQDPPEDLDWNLWLGPAPYMPYSPQRHYGFMGWNDYARGGQLTNWGVHLMDVVHWGIGEDRPLSIQAIGGSHTGNPERENYESIEAIFEYRGCNVTWEQRHSGSHSGKGYGIVFHGTKGRLLVDRGTFVVEPAGLGIPEFVGPPEKSWANLEHHNNFFDCVRSRKRPIADIEQGHRSTTATLLAGIALKARRKLNWDGENERFKHDEQANRNLARAYRSPWHLPIDVRKSLPDPNMRVEVAQ